MIPTLRTCIQTKFIQNSLVLYEKQPNFTMNIQVDVDKIQDHIIFKFDQSSTCLLPHFVTGKGLNKICDYVIVFQHNNFLKVLSIELKKSSSPSTNANANMQLKSTEIFINSTLKHIIRTHPALSTYSNRIKYYNIKVFDSRLTKKLRRTTKNNPLVLCENNIYDYQEEIVTLKTFR